jgi:hypothetical protein
VPYPVLLFHPVCRLLQSAEQSYWAQQQPMHEQVDR